MLARNKCHQAELGLPPHNIGSIVLFHRNSWMEVSNGDFFSQPFVRRNDVEEVAIGLENGWWFPGCGNEELKILANRLNISGSQ
jgi:hypothetical protein